VEIAQQSDVIVAVVGGSSEIRYPRDGEQFGGRSDEADSGEGMDRATSDLMGAQVDLLKVLKATGKPLVVVLIHGRAYSINWISENADAIVDAWFPGEAGGTAVAEVLYGDYNPGGKLAVSFPKHIGQIPVHYYTRYPGRTYVEMDSEPLYPFGFGLSFTTFEYSNLVVDPEIIPMGGSAKISVKVTNTGSTAGDEVVQLYVRDDLASVARPPRQLKGFERVRIESGETKTVTFPVGFDELRFFGLDEEWIVEPGVFTMMIGRNSREIELESTLTVSP